MREIRTSGTVGGEGGNILTYPAIGLSSRRSLAAWRLMGFAALYPSYKYRPCLTPA